jgi:hypothetical protein
MQFGVEHHHHGHTTHQADAARRIEHAEQPHPQLDEVMQRPGPVAAQVVPVRHDGPIHAQELPAALGTIFTAKTTTSGEQILGADRMRKRAVIISTDNPFVINVARSINGTGTSGIWPANVALELRNESALTVATSGGSAATLTVITENYAR